MLLISFVVILQCIDTELSIGIGILSLYVSSALLSYCVSISCTVYRLHLAFHNICGVDSFSTISFSVMECSEIGFSATFNLIDAFKLSSQIHILMCVYSLLVIRLQ